MTTVTALCTSIKEQCAAWIEGTKIALGELTIEVRPSHLLDFCRQLRVQPAFGFDMLMDVCGVDYLQYGLDDWQTESATGTGFSRGVMMGMQAPAFEPFEPFETRTACAPSFETRASHAPQDERGRGRGRFAVVYHLLSTKNNHRVRLRVNIPSESDLIVDSVIDIWPSANWFEREAFDLFGILFRGHPDLRRLLTDYGFSGHPFRKDFPLIGKVEARYDAKLKRVVYEPVSIEPRVLEPKVIRHDNRYVEEKP